MSSWEKFLCALYMSMSQSTFRSNSSLSEITQQQIDETRTIPERKMLEDLKFLLSEGHSLNYFDQQGASPVRGSFPLSIFLHVILFSL